MTPHVAIKPGVRVGSLTPALVKILAALDHAAWNCQVVLTVTCGREGHAPEDPHTRGAALDVRTNGLTESEIQQVYQHVQHYLTNAFTVLYEVPRAPVGALAAIAWVNPRATAPHFHIQVRKNTEWPPVEMPPGPNVAA